MLAAARGVSLGLGNFRVELNELPSLNDRAALGKLKRLKKKAKEKPRLVIKKKVDRKTLWAACRAVVLGAAVIGAGLFMTIIGYFDRDLTTSSIYNITTGEEVLVVDLSLRFYLKVVQYLGPVLMGFGTFMLIIACVITLESRDRHAQIIQEESKEFRRSKHDALVTSTTKTSLLPYEEEAPKIAMTKNSARLNGRVGHETDRPNVADFQHEPNEEDNIERTKLMKISDPHEATNKKEDNIVAVEIHSRLTSTPQRQHANNATSDVFGDDKPGPSTSNSYPSRTSHLSTSQRRLSDRRPHSPTTNRGRKRSTESADEPPAPMLAVVKRRPPRGAAPFARVDSVLELPLLTSASCSTLGTPSMSETRKKAADR